MDYNAETEGEGLSFEDGASPDVLPEGSIELHGNKEITEPQHLNGPLAERLALLGAEQYKVIIAEVFEPLEIKAGDIESISDESLVGEVFRTLVDYIQTKNEGEKMKILHHFEQVFPIGASI